MRNRTKINRNRYLDGRQDRHAHRKKIESLSQQSETSKIIVNYKQTKLRGQGAGRCTSRWRRGQRVQTRRKDIDRRHRTTCEGMFSLAIRKVNQVNFPLGKAHDVSAKLCKDLLDGGHGRLEFGDKYQHDQIFDVRDGLEVLGYELQAQVLHQFLAQQLMQPTQAGQRVGQQTSRGATAHQEESGHQRLVDEGHEASIDGMRLLGWLDDLFCCRKIEDMNTLGDDDNNVRSTYRTSR